MIHKNLNQFNALQLYGKLEQEPAVVTTIPRQLIEEVEKFKKRNTLKEFSKMFGTSEVNYEVCPSCLKAFMLSKAHEMHLPEDILDFLYANGEGSLGHNEYYQDNGKLIKIDEYLSQMYY